MNCYESLADYISEYSERNKNLQCTDVYSVTNREGFVPSNEFFSKKVFSDDLKAYKIVKKGMLAYNPSRINVGSVAVQDIASKVIVSPLYVVLKVEESKLLPEYLGYFLHSASGKKQIRFCSTGSVRSNVRFDTLKQLHLPIVDLSEQRCRIRILQQIDKQRNHMRSLASRIDDIVKSRFVEMFGDPCTSGSSNLPTQSISAFCELRIGPFGSALHKEDYIAGGHPLVNPSHIVGSHIIPDSELSIDERKYQSLEPYHLHKGDIVLGRRGEIGRCAVVEREGMLCGTGSMILRPDKALCRSDFLQRVVSFPSFAHALGKKAVGATLKNLNAKIVGDAVVVLPPIALQDQFTRFVVQADKSRFAIKQVIEKLETLEDSLMQQYFG